MIRLTPYCFATILSISTIACSSSWNVTDVKRTQLLVDDSYDEHIPSDVTEWMKPYSAAVDSIVKPVVGHAARQMKGERPESLLSNLYADILVYAARQLGENPVMGVCNMGGIRASLPQGEVTFGDVLEVAPFENKIVFLTLKGSELTELFENMAAVGGEGVSHGVELRISKNKKLTSARLHQEKIVPDKDYRIVTIDYLAEGNDKMYAFTKKHDYVAPKGEQYDTRFIIANYFRDMMKQGIVVDAKIEGRIIIE